MVIPSHKQVLQRAVSKLSHVISRRKTDEKDEGGSDGPQLARVLGFFDLTLLGVGSTLGVGVYVLAGAVAKKDSGPAVTIAFLVAAIASAFAGLCYAEFAARVPKAGSAYVYSYVTVGELAAFVIGWNLILEYVIGTASVARAFSNYLDTLIGNVMSKTLKEAVPLHVSFLSEYPDFLSFGIVLVLTVLLAYGVKESALMNNIFTALNLITVATVIIAGLFRVDIKNWSIPKSEIPPADKGGEGGFVPFGVSGIMAGAAKCFFGFVGFDCVATTGEEAKNPQRHIPMAIVTSLVIIFLAYFGISTVLTLMYPYYLQDVDAPLIQVFKEVKMPAISIIVSVGAIFALCTSMFGCVFPLPRVLYAMATDGLLPKLFAKINKKTQTPILSTVLSGIFSGLMGALFNLEQLIDMMSIGTLLAYTLVALCVLLLRYRQSKSSSSQSEGKITHANYFRQIFNLDRHKYPEKITCAVAEFFVFTFVVGAIVTTFCLVFFENSIPEGDPLALSLTIIFFVLTCISMIFISFQPKDEPIIFFKVPLIPFLPCISIFINIYLMMKLDTNTWIRFLVWLFIGALIYIFYSIPNSVEGKKERIARKELKTKLQNTTKL